MPVTRRSTRSTKGASAGGGAAGKQAKLSFKSRVTKSIKEGEKPYKSPSRAKEWKPPIVAKEEEEEEEEDEEEKDVKVKVEADNEDDETIATIAAAPAPAPVAAKKQQEGDGDDAIARAEKITDAAIGRYWKAIEDSRTAKEVHKKHAEGLETGEKVLRYFDVSSQYGPCIGIARLKRWQRANRLGLHPPIEVLAVLLKEEEKGRKGFEQKAHMDELLSTTVVGSA